MRKINLIIKRLFDILCSGVGLIVLSPLLLLTALIIKISMPGPVFFKQERVGKDGKLFNILKFRSMKVDKKAEESFDFSKDQDRLTFFG
ncbi:MAG: sugar transferase, partial [Erysipelotrichaceae bacterium]|nr:sugar transferase [Erysipelotrichaceae bacterium]